MVQFLNGSNHLKTDPKSLVLEWPVLYVSIIFIVGASFDMIFFVFAFFGEN